MDKAPDAFRTISEVADELDIPQHVLRFWESRFPQIKPMKRAGGRRYYRPDDVDLLRGIRASAVRRGLHHPRRAAHPARAGTEVRSGGVAARRRAAGGAAAETKTPEAAEQLAPDDAARTLFGLLKAPSAPAAEPRPKRKLRRRRAIAPAPAPPHLTLDQVRRLQSALHELRECRRLIDQALKDEAA